MTSFGMNPFYAPDQIPWMPKPRYQIMRDYLPTRADLGTSMMKTTCTVQGNYDYTSESDAADIIRTVAVTPDAQSVAILAGIVLIRTFLSFSLQLEVTGYWPWQTARARRQQAPPSAEAVMP
jgi:hypothetical protein